MNPLRIEQWQELHTICNVSNLVAMLGQGVWSEPAAPGPDWEAIHDAHNDATGCVECEGQGELLDTDDLLQVCPECGGDAHTGEVFEYWVVDEYLGQLLESLGEGVFDSDEIGILGHKVWCRTTSGQLIIADSCIEAAYRKHIRNHYGEMK